MNAIGEHDDETARQVPRRILFMTSNGTGLGHLNRAMAIARRLPTGFDARFLTLSQAVPVVARQGFRVDYHPSYRRPGSGSDFQWNMRLRERLYGVLIDYQPDLFVFDGVHPYRALTHVLTTPGAPTSVWCRRPMWKTGSAEAPLKRTAAFDHVLEPGELASELDCGPTTRRAAEAIRVGPIVFLDPRELLDRQRAAAELGLDPGRTTALVNLGQGGATDQAVARTLEHLAARPEVQVAALRSSIGSDIETPPGVIELDATFPMSRYFRAFDFAVAAAGYNAFHELVAFAVPTLFVPMPRQTDDQAARARWAELKGCGRAVHGATDTALEAQLDALLDPEVRARAAARCRELFGGNGAARAAQRLSEIALGHKVRPKLPDPGRFERWLRMSSHPVGPSTPLSAALTARDLLRHPERRRPQEILLAFGVPEGALADELERHVDPEVGAGRTLLVTDSLEFAAIRAAGVGVHRAPTPREAGVEPGSDAHRELIEDAIATALAPWRGSWDAKSFGRYSELSAPALASATEDDE